MEGQSGERRTLRSRLADGIDWWVIEVAAGLHSLTGRRFDPLNGPCGRAYNRRVRRSYRRADSGSNETSS